MATLLLSACAGTGGSLDPGAGESNDCVPSVPASVPIDGDPNQTIEDIVEAMTGFRQTADFPGEESIDDPNHGGVYGDRRGGIVVTVLDCSAIDVDELARIAGGSAQVRFVEVAHSWQELNGYRDVLVSELDRAGVPGDVFIESTPQGRSIEVRTPDLDALPSDFAASVPTDAYTVVESDDLPREG